MGPLASPPRPLPPWRPSMCPRFAKTRVECYAIDFGVPKIT